MELASRYMVRMGLPQLTRRLTSKKVRGRVTCASDNVPYPTGGAVLGWIDSLLGLLAKVLKAFMKW